MHDEFELPARDRHGWTGGLRCGAPVRTMLRVLAMACLLLTGTAQAQQDDLKADAVQRVIGAHDPAIFVATGALYLKQEAIRAARGKPLSAETLAAVDRLIAASVRDTAWFLQGWGAAIDRHLSSEEADEIAAHFSTEGGRLQRRVIELAVGEVLMSNYTFTDRIDHRLAASGQELKDMQQVVHDRQFNGIQDFSRYPDAVKFASGGAGVKYMKMLMIQGVEAITVHFEAVASQVRAVVAAAP